MKKKPTEKSKIKEKKNSPLIDECSDEGAPCPCCISDEVTAVKKNSGALQITKEMRIYDVLMSNPNAADILREQGIGCVGCPMAMMETLEQGANAHGLDVTSIVKKLNEKK